MIGLVTSHLVVPSLNLCSAELGCSWTEGLQAECLQNILLSLGLGWWKQTGLSAVHKGEISWSLWFMGPEEKLPLYSWINWKLAWRRKQSGGTARHSALLLHSDSKDFTSSPTLANLLDTAKTSCAQTIPASRTLQLGLEQAPTQHSWRGNLQPIHMLIPHLEQSEGGSSHLACLESSSTVPSTEVQQGLFGLCCWLNGICCP